MRWRWMLVTLLVASVTGKGKKHKHQKPGRAVLDRLSSTTLSEVTLTRDAEGLYPVPLDVGTFSVVASNATCGDNGAEEFCRDTPGKRGVVCDVCEGLDGSPSRRHLATFAVDGDPATWWQSPTQANGEEFSHVEFVASLPTVLCSTYGHTPWLMHWALMMMTMSAFFWNTATNVLCSRKYNKSLRCD